MVAVYFDGYYKIVLSSQSNEVYFPLLHLLGVGKHQLGEQWASSYGRTNVALFLFSHPSAPVPSTFFFSTAEFWLLGCRNPSSSILLFCLSYCLFSFNCINLGPFRKFLFSCDKTYHWFLIESMDLGLHLARHCRLPSGLYCFLSFFYILNGIYYV